MRTDQKYIEPISIDDLRLHSRQYIQEKIQRNNTDTHWALMADEIAKEVQQGRMAGPFEAPPWLGTDTVPLTIHAHTSNLLPLPHQDPIIAI